MSNRNYWVYCDDHCKFPAMTKEQIITAIADATGVTPSNIDDAFITKIKEQNKQRNLAFWVGTQAEYNAIQNPDPNTFYLFSDTNEIADIETLARNTAEEKATELIAPVVADLEPIKEKVGRMNKVLWIGYVSTEDGTDKTIYVEGLHNYHVLLIDGLLYTRDRTPSAPEHFINTESRVYVTGSYWDVTIKTREIFTNYRLDTLTLHSANSEQGSSKRTLITSNITSGTATNDVFSISEIIGIM